MATCSALRCNKEATEDGLCDLHLDVRDFQRKPPATIITGCYSRGCNEKHHAKGLCLKHYDEIRNPIRRTPRIKVNRAEKCVISNCSGKQEASNGMCARHYRRNLHGAPQRSLERVEQKLADLDAERQALKDTIREIKAEIEAG